MARKRFEIITGLTDVMAAIYSEDNLPSAVISAEDGSQPFTLHSLREEGLAFFEQIFLTRMRDSQNITPEETAEKLKVRLYKFFENYEVQSSWCYGSALSEKQEGFRIECADTHATKLCEDCA